MIGAWSGMRGSVSLAAALALPRGLPAARPRPVSDVRGDLRDARPAGADAAGADPPLGVRDDGAEEREELAGRRAADDGRARRARRARRRGVDARRHGRADARRCTSTAAAAWRRAPARPTTATAIEHRSRKYQKMVREVLDAQRAELVRMRNGGEISNEVMHRLERELDLEDERLEI